FIALGFAAGVTLLVVAFGWSHRGEALPLEYYLDMKVQPRHRGQSQNKFFADGRAMRMPVAGTVPFGGDDYMTSAGSPQLNPLFLQADEELYAGKKDDKWVTQLPMELDAKLLARGEDRFNIHCAVCHGRTGAGNGIT